MERTIPMTRQETRRWRLRWHHDTPWLLAFVLPAFLLVVVVQFYPLAYSLYLSVVDWSLTRSQEPQGFIGADNFSRILNDPVFHRAARNSLIISGGGVAVQMVLGIALAYLTLGNRWYMRPVRTTLILPMVIAPVAAGTLWRMMLNSRAGLVNYLLDLVGIHGPDWLAAPNTALLAVVLLETWQWTPFVLLVVIAGAAGIPKELLESAAIDGASRWQAFWKVELPLLTPVLLLAGMFRILDSLLSLDAVYSLTFGGPGYGTYTLTFFIYTLGLRNFNLGQAAAASWLFMAFTAVVIGLVFWLHQRTGAK